MRNRTPIVVISESTSVGNDQPIWIVGMRIDDRVKLTRDTRKVLRLTFFKNPPK